MHIHVVNGGARMICVLPVVTQKALVFHSTGLIGDLGLARGNTEAQDGFHAINGAPEGIISDSPPATGGFTVSVVVKSRAKPLC